MFGWGGHSCKQVEHLAIIRVPAKLRDVTVCLTPCVLSAVVAAVQIRGIKTNIPFMENVLRHPAFMAGAATTGFIETYSKELFKFEGHSNIRANKLLLYLADMVSNSSNTAFPLRSC